MGAVKNQQILKEENSLPDYGDFCTDISDAMKIAADIRDNYNWLNRFINFLKRSVHANH